MLPNQVLSGHGKRSERPYPRDCDCQRQNRAEPFKMPPKVLAKPPGIQTPGPRRPRETPLRLLRLAEVKPKIDQLLGWTPRRHRQPVERANRRPENVCRRELTLQTRPQSSLIGPEHPAATKNQCDVSACHATRPSPAIRESKPDPAPQTDCSRSSSQDQASSGTMPERSPHPTLMLRRVASAREITKSTCRRRAKWLDADFHAAIIDLSLLPRDLRNQDAKIGD